MESAVSDMVDSVDELLLSDADNERIHRTRVTRDGSRFEILLPGTSTMDVDRRGHVKLDCTLEYFVASRHMAFMNPDFFLMQIQEAGFTYFLLQVKYVMSKKYYSTAKMQQVHFAKKMIVDLFHISKSTISLLSTLQDATTGEELARSYAKLIRVNFLERKSAPLPDGFAEKYSKYYEHGEDFEMITDSKPARNSYSNTYPIRHSDTDQNRHVNHATYVNLCLDAATEASLAGGYFPNFSGDICERNVKEMQVSYVKESKAGESLTVTAWQDEQQGNMLKFRVTKADGSLSMLCVMEFYGGGIRAML